MSKLLIFRQPDSEVRKEEERLRLEFNAIRAHMKELGTWDQFSAMWHDARRAALRDARKRK